VSMNSLLFQTIAARAGSSSNPAIADLLSRFCSSSDGNPAQDLGELLSQLGNGNPLISALTKHFAEMQTNASARPQPPVIDVEPETGKSGTIDHQIQKSKEDFTGCVSALRQDVQSMSAELKVLRERNDLLAATLGACCLCWGQDAECRFCRGRGRPGFAMPDEAHLGEFVLPAIQMLRAQRAKSNGSSPSPKAKIAETGA
jgi:hypothetical protein